MKKVGSRYEEHRFYASITRIRFTSVFSGPTDHPGSSNPTIYRLLAIVKQAHCLIHAMLWE